MSEKRSLNFTPTLPLCLLFLPKSIYVNLRNMNAALTNKVVVWFLNPKILHLSRASTFPYMVTFF